MQREVVLVFGKTGSGKTSWARRFISGKNRVIVLDAGFGDYDFERCSSLPDLVERTDKLNANGNGFFRLSYTPLISEYPFVIDLCRIVGKSWLVIEEADRLDGPKIMGEYDEAISRGRHYGLNLLAVSLYPFKLPAELRRQATRLICFQTHEPRDLDYLQEIIGEDVERLPDLPKFAYLDWSVETGSKIVGDSPAPEVKEETTA